MTLRLTVFLAAAALPVAAFAAPFADPAAIDREVAAFTGVPQGQPGGAHTEVPARKARSGSLHWNFPPTP